MARLCDVVFNKLAKEDLERLLDHSLEDAMTLQDLERAQEVLDELRLTIEVQLARTLQPPQSGQPVSPRAGGTGRQNPRFAALYDIRSPWLVEALAMRHQREDNYH